MRHDTKELYPDNWPVIRELVIEEEGFTCRICGRSMWNFLIFLAVHHWDHNPANNARDNLAPLCQGCHLVQESGSLRSFGSLRNEFIALRAGQLWLPGLERSDPKTPDRVWLNKVAKMTRRIAYHVPRDNGRSQRSACQVGRG